MEGWQIAQVQPPGLPFIQRPVDIPSGIAYNRPVNTDERRQAILNLLSKASQPIIGSELAERMGVSRQVIVQDMAVLRAGGYDVLASPQGYFLYEPPVNSQRTIVAVCHSRDETEDELLALVDVGVEIVDVIVEHEIYGEQRGMLHIASREDVHRFMSQLYETGAKLLSELTGGIHLHTLEARRPEQLDRAREVLQKKGFLVE